MTSRSSAPRTWGDPKRHFDAALEAEWYRQITLLNSVMVRATNSFFESRGLHPALMPVTVSSVSSPMGLGSDSLPVKIDLFGEKTYLADSLQFQLEFLLRHATEGVYYVMPTFRGEDPDATHLNQFFHSEAEIRGGLEDVIGLVEDYLGTLCAHIAKVGKTMSWLAEIGGNVDAVRQVAACRRFPRVTFREAQEMLPPERFAEVAPGVLTIRREGEIDLLQKFSAPVWLTHPPHLSVPFYQAVNADGTGECADLLIGRGEVVGCGQRHRSREEAETALAQHRVSPSEYEWYLEMKERTPMHTAGFGLGLERFMLWVLDHDDVRDLHVMPRIKGVTSWV